MTADLHSPTEASDSVLLQRVMFAPVTPIASEDLYVDVTEGSVINRTRTAITIGPFSTASTRTYFGRFPAAYYHRWTGVRELLVEATVNGSGRLRVFASDNADRERIVGAEDFTDAQTARISIPVSIDRFLDGGFIWVSFETFASSAAVADVRFATTSAARVRQKDVVICTHNRTSDCVATLAALASDALVLDSLRTVYVVDQGTERVADEAGFAEISEQLGAKLRYIQQGNLGGAGGFTRGILESRTADSATSDIILMDDDIVLEPESILRMTAFSAHALQPLIVGAQMLYLFHPNLLHTSAETADLARLRAGLPVNRDESSLDLTESLPYEWAEGTYNAWWTCLIPSEVVDQMGYPLPMFFQWDDIEYGLRAREHGVPTVTLTGSAVWHADFSLKDRDDWSRYFSMRNSLIVAALHSDTLPKKPVKVLALDFLHLLLAMQYGLLATLLKGIEGFLDGPSTLDDGGVSAIRDIRQLRSHYPDTVQHKPSEIVEQRLFALPAAPNPGPPRIPSLVVAKRLVYQVLRYRMRTGKLSSADNSWHHSALFSEAIVTDAGLGSFRIRRLERGTAWRLTRESVRVLWRLRTDGRRVSAQWRKALPSLTTRERWATLYGHVDDAKP